MLGSATANGGTGYGIYGVASINTTDDWAGYFNGDVNVTGTVFMPAKMTRIDHPLDPANRYLLHSFVESPDMLNVYNGNIVTDAQGLARMRTGFTEMEEDLAEVDTLINDLLTSGRLELGRGNALQLSEVGVCELCKRAASRFSARVECPDELEIRGDALLLERLLRNLLANARRACPEGELTLRGLIDEGHVVIEVEDEGPGVPLDKRSLIFEPFARLDAARARDHGGVGLGLHLCRQIAAAHGGTLRAMERRDGRPGARFVLRL